MVVIEGITKVTTKACLERIIKNAQKLSERGFSGTHEMCEQIRKDADYVLDMLVMNDTGDGNE